MKNWKIASVVVLLVLNACSFTPDKLNVQEYRAWIDDRDNGLISIKNINGITLFARFLPAEYQAYQDYHANPQQSYDSVLSLYKCSLTFQISLQADKETGNYKNLMYYNIYSQPELTERTRVLSFNAAEFIDLTYKGVHYKPVLSAFEGYNPMANRISLLLAFVLPEYPCGNDTDENGEFQLTFDDPYWELGTNHFVFEKNTLSHVPGVIQ